MGKVGKISVIPKDFSGPDAFPTMEKSLRDNAMSRAPGTVRMFFPYKDLSGTYRTGLDENGISVKAIQDDQARERERQRLINLRKRLEEATGLDLSNRSQYYNYTSRNVHKVEPIKLMDGDNIFNLDDPWQSITYHWLKAHPAIASSLQDYYAGKYPADTQYYINDVDTETEIQYRKKKTANDAIIRFDNWSLEKRKKVARLLDLPVGEDAKEEYVYNLVDNFLKGGPVARGVHQGMDPIKVFSLYADLRDEELYVKDLVEQSLKHQIYKVRGGGKVYEGELEVFRNKEELIEFFVDERNQIELLELEKKLNLKKLARV